MRIWKSLLRVTGLSEEAAQTPDGTRVFAVGDIHGRLDLLQQLIRLIDADTCHSPRTRNIIIFLGDLIDRGPDSAGVVEHLITLSRARKDVFCLLGNHEEALLRAIKSEPGWLTSWLKFGGDACAASYGINPRRLLHAGEQEGAAQLRSAIPETHINYLRSLQDTISIGGYLFVHAGIRPGVPIPEQTPEDLRWIREPFLSDDKPHGAVVVHGHTVVDLPEDVGNRIGIDTGAYYSGRLTALVLEGSMRRYISTNTASQRWG